MLREQLSCSRLLSPLCPVEPSLVSPLLALGSTSTAPNKPSSSPGWVTFTSAQWVSITPPLTRSDSPPQERIRTVLEYLWSHYQGGSTTCFLALLALTSDDDDISSGIQRVFRKWITGFTEVIRASGVPLKEAKLRAEDAVIQIQGALVVAIATNDPGPFQRVMRKLGTSLLN